MVEKAIEYKLGARGLRSICEAILNDAMFELPSQDVNVFNVTLEYAEKKFNITNLSMLKVAWSYIENNPADKFIVGFFILIVFRWLYFFNLFSLFKINIEQF